MTSSAIGFEGTLCAIGQGDGATVAEATDTFDIIGEVSTFSFSGGDTTVINASHAQSVAADKILGLPDEGQFTLTVNMVPANAGQLSVQEAKNTGQLRNVRLTLADAGALEIDFKGYAIAFAINGSVDDKVEASITFEITGAAVFTP